MPRHTLPEYSDLGLPTWAESFSSSSDRARIVPSETVRKKARFPGLSTGLFIAATLAFLLSPTPARAWDRPIRITLGYDTSRSDGYDRGNLLGSAFSGADGSGRLGLSFDVYRSSKNKTIGFVYADLSTAIFDNIYDGYGLGFRFYPVPKIGGYAGAAVGLYDVEDNAPNEANRGIGLKLSLGYELTGPFFVETGITLIAADGYEARPAFLLGLRF